MEIIIAGDYEAMSGKAALLIAGQVLSRPDSVVGLATGSTPLGAYRRLTAMYQEGLLDFSRVTSFNLDEYYGLAPDSPCSYQRFMAENLFSYLNINPANTYIPDGLAEDVEGECRRYEERIQQAGGIDLQLLGIGGNGHIGFNEPADAFSAGTHLVSLTEETIEANARFFSSPQAVPRQAMSMGIRSIMSARRIVLLANGSGKAPAVKAMVEGPITPRVPASVLQLHPHTTVILDGEAAAMLS